ncbi:MULTISPECIES: mannitol dehydrogenase family protein [unclassified Rathayibacter]|uniref:mannitol dehydrogenase family protein n=1 Tax=unclassified Rathayibacter TaxID=2609250 RepID=UPI001045D3BE|nr:MULTISPECIES: mannitol dehydrogenase family protein [unclassified Rathayibacter]TCL82726.1 mannitol 2-dehydrogenase [Rathayibacter sp. PhB192]TCM28065.1 mannitol 2-dehydrogenase [Rathayibacter sp. PhB179]
MTTSHIVHFGVGNFHRSHQAKYLHELHQQGHDLEWTIVGAGLLPGDVRMRDALQAQDYTYTLVERAADGTDEVHRVASISGYLYGPDDPAALIELLADPSTRIVSLTITEGGYNLSDTTGRFDTSNSTMRADTWRSEQPMTVFGYLAAALRRRRRAGVEPFTVMSCDNIQNNGDMAREALASFIRMTDLDLADWVEETTAFPGSMVDRITPVTTDADREWVRATTGYEDAWPVISEDFTQWVIEENFPTGRPHWENVGAQLVEDVAPFETMKLRMLNGSHQALAYIGLLNGYTFVHEAMADVTVATFVDVFMTEAQSTVPPVEGIDLHDYRALLLQRFSNPAIRDTLERLATDASDRIPKFVVPIAQDLLHQNRIAPATAAVIASWVATVDQSRRSTQPLKDRQAGDVEQGLLDERVVSGSFLDRPDWFSTLGDDPTFRAAYTFSLDHFRRQGAPLLPAATPNR